MKLKKININESKGFVVLYKVKKDLTNKGIKPSQVKYTSEKDAQKFVKSIEKDGGRGMIINGGKIQISKANASKSKINGLSEATEEPQVIQDLRWILKHNQNKKIKDPVSGRTIRVDLFSASAVIQVYDAIKDSNKKKYVTASLPKMVSMAFKLIK